MMFVCTLNYLLIAAEEITKNVDPVSVIWPTTAGGCLIWLVWYLNSKTLPAVNKQNSTLMEAMHNSHQITIQDMQDKHAKTIEVMHNSLTATIQDMQLKHGKTIEIMQAQAVAASDMARSHFLQALEVSQKQSAEERKQSIQVVSGLQREYIQQVEFQRKQCTEEHIAKDRLLERLMDRAGLSKTEVKTDVDKLK